MSAPERARETLHTLAEGVVFRPVSRGRVRLTGKDARGFLHRMSTQHVEALAPGEARLSVLTNKQGRVVDVVHHLTLGPEEVVLLGARPEGAPIASWLDGFLFVEKVVLEDLTEEGAVILVAGSEAARVAGRLVEGAAALAPWAMASAGSRVAVRTFDVADGAAEDEPAFLIWDRALAEAGLADAARGAGAYEADADGLEAARVAAGVPAFPGEVSDRVNPLELELHDAIHWSKGCYIGQEVIARIDNYGKQARVLAGVVVEERDLGKLAVGDELKIDDKPAGELTSVAPVAVGGLPVALALARHRGEVEGVHATVTTKDGEVEARLMKRKAAQAPHD